MKKPLRIIALLLATWSLTLIQSCTEDEATPVGPTLTAPSGAVAVQINTAVDVTFTFEAPGKYKSSSVTATGGTATVKTPPAANATTGSVVVEFTAGNAAGAGTVVLTLVDMSNQEDEATAVLNISLSAPPSLTLTSAVGEGDPGTSVSVTANITAPNGASQLIITGATSTPASPITITGTSPSQVVNLAITSDAVIGSTILVVFSVKDAQNLISSSQNFTITVTDPTIVLEGSLATRTLVSTESYLLKGQVFIPDGVTLTIPAGTVIKGEKSSKAALIVQPGGKLNAIGTSTNPIVFTSAQPVGARDRGDWGGILVLGKAYVNQTTRPAIEGINPTQNYGSSLAESATPATNADDNSGTIKYVRIEYAGVELTPNNETNSLTMGGVGNGTTVEYVQTSFGGDDAFEWFGGTVNAKYLVSLSTWDDDFDTDFGWSGNVQWGLVVRNPFFADQSGSNAFESDNQGNGNAIVGLCDMTAGGTGSANGCTKGVFSNITVLGPRDIQSRAISANYQNAMHIRRRSSISVFNSFFSGYRIGLRVDDNGTWFNINNGHSVFANNVITVPGTAGTASSATAADGLFVTGIQFAAANDGTIDASTAGNATSIANLWSLTNSSFNTITTATPLTDIGITTGLHWATLTAGTYPSNPNFALGAGTGGNNLNTGAAFSNGKLTGGFFNTTGTYRGAFGANDWTDGWSEFQPINKIY